MPHMQQIIAVSVGKRLNLLDRKLTGRIWKIIPLIFLMHWDQGEFHSPWRASWTCFCATHR
jgi:hypothetical protein